MDGFAHFILTSGSHLPAPSHTRACTTSSMFEQAAGAQDVPAAYSAQRPATSHRPFVWQLAGPLSMHIPRGSGVPRGTGRHNPFDSGSAHERHAIRQSDSQHTPSAQKPLTHSAPMLHAPPFGVPALPPPPAPAAPVAGAPAAPAAPIPGAPAAPAAPIPGAPAAPAAPVAGAPAAPPVPPVGTGSVADPMTISTCLILLRSIMTSPIPVPTTAPARSALAAQCTAAPSSSSDT